MKVKVVIKTLLFKKKQNRFNYYKNMIVFSVVFTGFMTTMEQAFKPYFSEDMYKYIRTYNVNEGCNYRGTGRRNCLTST